MVHVVEDLVTELLHLVYHAGVAVIALVRRHVMVEDGDLRGHAPEGEKLLVSRRNVDVRHPGVAIIVGLDGVLVPAGDVARVVCGGRISYP